MRYILVPYSEAGEFENTEFDYGHNINHKTNE